jgi:hypothetical protein
MRVPNQSLRGRAAALAGMMALACCSCALAADSPAPTFDDTFWQRWGDGNAELAGYDLVQPRYGQKREGVAVTVFVTETFSNSLRVKSDPGKHPESDEFPVMKLNLVEDFPTGIYDYNLMTSTFVALKAVNGRPAGSPTKISFSSQEWCGNVYAQALFDATAVRHESHSYFDGEADRQESLAYPEGGTAEDALLLWARGFTAPLLKPGESRSVDMMKSLKTARLLHQPVTWQKAKLTRGAQAQKVKVPAGTFDVEVRSVAIEGGRTWTFYVELAEPRRVVKWEASDGEEAQLLASDRMKYWQMNGKGFESSLAKLGLKPRGARMP